MSAENKDPSIGSLYSQFLEAAAEIAENPNHSAKFMAVADEMSKEAIEAIRQRVEMEGGDKSN
jgi:S-methylmethionine-dependent homocysteine/selenocysteine methylase